MASIVETLNGLAACLCAQIASDGNNPTCFCGVIPGQAAVADYMGDCDHDGMAWVRLITSYPAEGVGRAAQTLGACAVGIGFDVEVGILRNMPVEVEGIDEATAAVAVDQQMADMQTIRRAIQCCDSLGNKDYILGAYVPAGPQGAVVGGAWTVYVMV